MPGHPFDRRRRLLAATDYRRVFSQPQRIADSWFTILVRENGLDHPRLGLAISRKNARRAVDRNRLKRVARESFRHHQARLAGLDAVVMARAGAASVSSSRLRASLDDLWQRAAAIAR